MAGTRRKEVKKDSGDKDRKNDVDNGKFFMDFLIKQNDWK